MARQWPTGTRFHWLTAWEVTPQARPTSDGPPALEMIALMSMRNSKPGLPSNVKPCFRDIGKKSLHAHKMGEKTQLWQRLRFARKHAGSTQQVIADACGISREAVSQWESPDPQKRTAPALAHLRVVSSVTGAPLEWLLTDGDDLAVEHWLDAPIDAGNQKPSQSVSAQRAMIAAVVRLTDYVREMALAPIPEQKHRAIVDASIAAVESIGAERILDGSALVEGAKQVVAEVRSR